MRQGQIGESQKRIDNGEYQSPKIEDLIEDIPSVEKTVLLKRDIDRRFREVLGAGEGSGELFNLLKRLEDMEKEIEEDFDEWVKDKTMKGMEFSPAYGRIKYLYEVSTKAILSLKQIINNKVFPVERGFQQLFNRWEADAEQIASAFYRMKAEREYYKKEAESAKMVHELNELMEAVAR